MRTCNSDNGDWFLLSELCAILDSLYAIYCVLFEPYKVRDRLLKCTQKTGLARHPAKGKYGHLGMPSKDPRVLVFLGSLLPWTRVHSRAT
jgi:hypothetical protein